MDHSPPGMHTNHTFGQASNFDLAISSRHSSGSSLPYLNEPDLGSDSDSESAGDSVGNGQRVTLDGKGMYSRADMNADGRIEVLLDLKHQGVLDLPGQYALSVIEQGMEIPPRDSTSKRSSDGFASDCPALSIVIQIVGSRGDVQPYLSLAIDLILLAGHRVRIATHGDFKDFVLVTGRRVLRRRWQAMVQQGHVKAQGHTAAHGNALAQKLEFFLAGGSPKELMAYMVKNPGLMPGYDSLTNGDVHSKRRMVKEMLQNFYHSLYFPDAETGKAFACDAIIANPPSFAAPHLAEAFGLPLMLSFTMAWSPTAQWAHPLVNIKQSNASPQLGNYLSFGLAELMTWQGLASVINKFRTKTLGIHPLSNREGVGLADRLKVPFMYCWSPSVIPKPADWKEHIEVVGYFFLNDSEYEPNAELTNFLKAGPPPIYIGFGSIVVDDPDALTAIIFEATKLAGVRALVSAGWSALGGNNVPDNIHLLGPIPHEWLFAEGRVAAVVHHGGAGTTAIGLRNGLPTVIVPFFGDQPWQGDMVANAGAGPKPIPFKKLTVEGLAEAITSALSPEAQCSAGKLGKAIRQEHGESSGVASFHRHLPLLHMRCDLQADQVAAWWSAKYALRLGTLAAAVLLDRGLIKPEDIETCRAREYLSTQKELFPLEGGIGSILELMVTQTTAIAQLFYKPKKGAIKTFTVWPLAIVELHASLNSLPRFYGSKVRTQEVSGLRSGLKEGGKSVFYGYADAFSGLITTPKRGFEKAKGAAGAFGGVLTSLMDLSLKPAFGLLGMIAHPLKGAFLSYDRWKRQGLDPLRPSRFQIGQDLLSETSEWQRDAIVEAFEQAVLITDQRKTKLRQEALLAMQDADTGNEASASPLPLSYDNGGLPGKYRKKEQPSRSTTREKSNTKHFV